jgi:cytochrome P450
LKPKPRAADANSRSAEFLRRTSVIEYDPFSYEIHDNPYPTYRSLRQSCPVYYNPRRGFWALSRYADVRDALRNWRTFSSAHGVSMEAEYATMMFIPKPGFFIDLDPPRQKELRSVIQTYFTPKRIATLEPRVRQYADELIDRFVDRGHADLAKEYAQALPLRVICELLGISRRDEEFVVGLADEYHFRYDGDDRVPESSLKAGFALRNYFDELVAARRKRGRGDLLSEMTSTEVAGRLLTDEEIVGMCFLIFTAGHDTTTQLIGHALLLLADRPDERARLAGDESAIQNAVEEFLRYESPVSVLARTTTREVMLRGCTIPAGSKVLMLFGCANRDEDEFDAPERLDLTRKPKRHLAFGEGVHFCVGAPLARMEGVVALDTFLKRIPGYELAGRVERHHYTGMRGVVSLPVRF